MTQNTAFEPGPDGPGTGAESGAGPQAASVEERLALLEAQVQTLAQALRSLAMGLEEIPSQEPVEVRQAAARGARLAHELLLSQGM